MTAKDLDDFISRIQEISKEKQTGKKAKHKKDEVTDISGQINELRELIINSKYRNIYNINGDAIMGDVFRGINNSTIINRSNVEDALNFLIESDRKELADALEDVGRIINSSSCKEAGIVYEAFVNEASKQEPNTGFLRSTWDALISALPRINEAINAVETIRKIFL